MKKDVIDECINTIAIAKHVIESPELRVKLFKEVANNIYKNNNLLKRLKV